MDKAVEKAKERAGRKIAKIKDRRRFKVGVPADGITKRLASKTATGTKFPNTILEPGPNDEVLLCGGLQRKIGGDVLVGRLKGARILCLTLEERATCPRSCLHWRSCYGNGMQYSKRWAAGRDLEKAIRNQIRRYFETGEGVTRPLLVRLHILGDFYSMRYLRMWVELMDTYPRLHLFGFTAHGTGSRMGAAIKRVREAAPDQFAIRTSGESGDMGSWTIDWPTEKRFVRVNGDRAIVCPEQLDANAGGTKNKHCGNCAACWDSKVAVAFIEH